MFWDWFHENPGWPLIGYRHKIHIQNNRTRKNLVAFNGGKNFGNIFSQLDAIAYFFWNY